MFSFFCRLDLYFLRPCGRAADLGAHLSDFLESADKVLGRFLDDLDWKPLTRRIGGGEKREGEHGISKGQPLL